MKQTKNEDYIVVGYSNSFKLDQDENNDSNQTSGNFLVLKLDKNGNSIWRKSFGAKGDDHPFATILTKKGDIIIGGTSDSEPFAYKKAKKINEADFWILKIDSDGNYIWDQTFDYGKYDKLVSISENKDGTLILGGYAQTENPLGQDKNGINDYILLKTDENANKIWEQSFGGNDSDILVKAFQSRDGNYILAGTSNSEISRNKRVQNQGQNDFWLLKVNDKENKSDFENQVLEIYPNPTQRFVNIILHENLAQNKAKLYDLSGVFLKEIALNSSTTVLDLEKFPKGIYILTFNHQNKEISKKIIKN